MGHFPNYASPFSARILVVDDSPENLFLIESILREEDHEIRLASDGETALAMVRQMPPDLILLDVMMPNMDGFEVTQHLREDPHLPYIPILLITAHDQPSVVRGLDSGADDFLRKPVNIDELLARVRSLLRLKQSIDGWEQMVRIRDDMVSRLTHDLRTPLIAADRMLSLMKEGEYGTLPLSLLEVISIMMRSNQNLLNMVNQLLEIYRYEDQRKILNFTPVPLLKVINEVIAELTPLIQEKRLTLGLKADEKQSFLIRGDRLELYRLVTNLLSNAIKFTDEGSILLELTINQDILTLKVQDTGSGISPDLQKVLFNRFQSGRHHSSGSGLGLHLCRQIVESHDGTIEVESELEKGSIFLVSFPLWQDNLE